MHICLTYVDKCTPSPVFAAMITLLNSLRAREGLGPVGFINPTLYSSMATTSFNDVTSGINNYCSYKGSDPSMALKCSSGFTAAAGWDPITGLGSISFPKLAALFNITVKYNRYSQTFQVNDLFTYSIFGMSPFISQVLVIVVSFLVIQILCNAGIIIYVRRCKKNKAKIAIQPPPSQQLQQ